MNVAIPSRPVNYKDIAFKVFWTGVAAALGLLAKELTDAPLQVAPFIVMAINYGLAMIRQYIGVTPPDLPSPPT